ncbi:hypothetical protein OSB04_021018 [Centaurea solstitialis]|uniref:Zinc finger LSD1-type domain-containing protein n=1 Tax=Centaurea solstitialis TaxID=347529 RepID=A0AA38STF3_9ASTR|nr:hypothetical protein OSB04_021018 [Centaurea solstitialis]
MQSQIVCSGCRSILLYPRGAANVCCALCNAVTSAPPADSSRLCLDYILGNLEIKLRLSETKPSLATGC